MASGEIPPEFQFLSSSSGSMIVVLLGLLLLAVTLLWARQPGKQERWLAVGAASLTSLLVILISLAAVAFGWWQGAFFTAIPFIVLASFYLPFSISGYTLWLGWYRWLASRFHYAFWAYAVVVLAFIPIVLVADALQMQRGQFSLGGGYTVWSDTLAGQLVMWSPFVFYKILQRIHLRRAARLSGKFT